MSVETLNNSNEDLRDLVDLKEQVDKPWQVKYIHESKDKKYDIYVYILAQWWTKWWIKNKYINQIWPRIEWTQFTDVNWNEIKKDKFDAWEKVFLRVPKKKETINQKEKKNIPWKVEYIWNKKDKQNRNWKFYSYTFTQWGNIWWAMNKFDSQLWKNTRYERYCDMNWNKLKKEWFNKWETIYYKEPNTDIIDPTPEITIEEVMNLSNEKIMDLWLRSYYCELTKINHEDKNWNYSILNGKKVYLYFDPKKCKNGRVYFFVEAHETAGNVYSISIFKKEWNKFRWIYYDLWGRVYRWNLKTNSYYEIIPEKQDY